MFYDKKKGIRQSINSLEKFTANFSKELFKR